MAATVSRQRSISVAWSTVLASGALCLACGIWFTQVQKHVPEAHMDEVFHIRQAEVYWHNQWTVWDSKITTPPGLYFCGYLWLWILRILQSPWGLNVELRSLNLFSGLCVLYPICLALLDRRSNQQAQEQHSSQSRRNLSSMKTFAHTAVNICLFPPLFFFYALYYTDVLSAALVLLSYCSFHARMTKTMLVLSLIALLFRQTNIFWVTVYLGALEVVRNIQQSPLEAEFSDHPSFGEAITKSWQTARLYDCLASEACFEDYLKCGISLAMVSLANPRAVLRSLLPYMSLLGTFGTFVLWNRGVVLGDKSNHTASVHLTQMLYIWPYFTFFSLPILYPYFLILLPSQLLPPLFRSVTPHNSRPRVVLATLICIVMAVVVHFNTIIHPFTMADNRHYTFYVFRLLLRHPSIKYLVIPLYFFGAWATILSFGGMSNTSKSTSNSTKSRTSQNIRRIKQESQQESGKRCSFVLIWILSTSLSLITAPLVEPRYFIIPWLIWRLEIPPHLDMQMSSLSTMYYKQTRDSNSARQDAPESPVSKDYDHRLFLETAWFMVINAATCYIFLHWGFEWKQEPGDVQRFMW